LEFPGIKNITIDAIHPSFLEGKNIELSVLRLDKIHPEISGNKWFKLEDAKRQTKKNIVTFGGAWSNHIAATAAICKFEGLGSVGIIRGEKPAKLSATLLQAAEAGMRLVFTSRGHYRNKEIPEELLLPENYIIPEGGFGQKGAAGAAAIADCYNQQIYTHIFCACGTGTTLAGIVNASIPGPQIIGVSVLKNNKVLEQDVKNLLIQPEADFSILHDYHFGGYAKKTDTLINFMNDFYEQTGIPSDFVYTGKLFFGIDCLIASQTIPSGSSILAIHTGGLQGNLSLKNGMLIF
jgi:1-aminocyclopropane-1-carboxylate deaminase